MSMIPVCWKFCKCGKEHGKKEHYAKCDECAKKAKQKGFTLIEMTIVMAIIAILSIMALSVYATAASQAKGMRTRAIVAKIDSIIGEKWEAYRTRQVPIRLAPGTNPNLAAQIRVDAIRELQRFELPDRITDVTAGPAYQYGTEQIPQANYPVYALNRLTSRPSINKQYLRQAFKAHPDTPPPWNVTGLQYWTPQNENAECLYLILSFTRDGDKSALDYFSPTEIGDVDNDGMNEILDSFGQPIAFLRWAPGYRADSAPYPVTPQRRNDSGLAADPTDYPDPFDPVKVYGTNNIALKPLIWSPGPDKRHDMNVGTGFIYATTTPANDPYVNSGAIGTPMDTNGDGALEHTDNITNHDLEAR